MTSTCKISTETINGKLHLVNYPSYAWWTSEYDDGLTLSPNTGHLEIPAETLSDINFGECEEKAHYMGVCKRHYDLYWDYVTKKEEHKCRLDHQNMNLSLKAGKNQSPSLFDLFYQLETSMMGHFLFFDYTQLAVGFDEFEVLKQLHNMSPNFPSRVVTKAIEKIKSGGQISIADRNGPPIIFRYSNGVMYFEEHVKAPLGILVRIRKFALSKELMIEKLLNLLN